MLRAIGLVAPLAALLVLALPAATRLALVTAPEASIPSTDEWLGVWRDGQNVVWISLNPNELVTVVGAAYSDDPVGKVSHANVQFETMPMGNRISLIAESDPCSADFLNFGGQLIVRDNGQCGGARLNGVYTHQ